MRSFWKDILREIWNTRGRFISLLIITVLGAASVVGIQAAAIDMRDVADLLYKERSLYDFQIKSTVGFYDDDIAALRATQGVATVMPTRMWDAFIKIGDNIRVARAYAMPDTLNKVELLDGRLPQNAAECVIEYKLSRTYPIGSAITLQTDGDNYGDVFTEPEFTVVGIVSSPLFVSDERGRTTLGDGALHCYMYLHPDAFAVEVYTDVYVRMHASQELYNLSDDYEHAADSWMLDLEATGDGRISAFKAEIADAELELADAERELADGWAEYNDGLAELEAELSDARRELSEAEIELADAEAELADALEKLDSAELELNDGQIILDAEIAEGEARLDESADVLAGARIELDMARAELEELAENIATLQTAIEYGVPEAIERTDELEYMIAMYGEGIIGLEFGESEYAAGIAAIESGRMTLETERLTAQAEIVKGRIELETGRREYNEGLREYNEGLAEYEQGLADLAREEADARAELREANWELLDAEQEIADARAELDDLPEVEWFAFRRSDGVAFDSYYQDTQRLQKIGYVFPMVFFIVAILVSLTTMSRMVEDDRTQIGIYKALGYGPVAIMAKYLLYATASGLIGGILGVFIGSELFPRVISDAYGFLYNMPPVATPIPPVIGMISITAAVASVLIVTLITCIGAMYGVPAELMRPKSPPVGKRVFIERIRPLWNRLSFTGKVTGRNIFRYKKRFIMTLIGVAGCSALLLTAFGLRDSISGVSELQYGRIVQYDSLAYLKDIKTPELRAEIEEFLPSQYLFAREESVTAQGVDGSMSASLIVPESAEMISQYYSMRTPAGAELTLGERGLIITDKLAETMGVAVGDEFVLVLGDGRELTVRADAIAENYVLHYVYIAPALYSELFDAEPIPNSVMGMSDSGSGAAFGENALQNGNVRAVLNTAELLESLKDSTDVLGVVTIVLIVLACALALVVLFNLTNINISERIRELATIKVLGFHDNEVSMYVYRENGIVTAMGIGLGILLGIALHSFVLISVEIDLLRFPHIIRVPSYLYAVALSAAFAVFVNIVMNGKLKAIDMVESLKGVE